METCDPRARVAMGGTAVLAGTRLGLQLHRLPRGVRRPLANSRPSPRNEGRGSAVHPPMTSGRQRAWPAWPDAGQGPISEDRRQAWRTLTGHRPVSPAREARASPHQTTRPGTPVSAAAGGAHGVGVPRHGSSWRSGPRHGQQPGAARASAACQPGGRSPRLSPGGRPDVAPRQPAVTGRSARAQLRGLNTWVCMCPHVTPRHVSPPRRAAWCPLEGGCPRASSRPAGLPRSAQPAGPSFPANPQAS